METINQSKLTYGVKLAQEINKGDSLRLTLSRLTFSMAFEKYLGGSRSYFSTMDSQFSQLENLDEIICLRKTIPVPPKASTKIH